MSRRWITANRLSNEYEDGVAEFCEFARAHATRVGEDYVNCPCRKCWNVSRLTISEVRTHLIINGFDTKYTVWYFHGERVGAKRPREDEAGPSYTDVVADADTDEGVDHDNIQGMFDNINENLHESAGEIRDSIKHASETPLYPGCNQELTKLTAILKLYNLKAKHSWSDKSFTELLALLGEMLPAENVLPRRCYDAKKVLFPMGSGVEKIHACPNDCILYRGSYEDLSECPICKAHRYKRKDVDESKGNGGPIKTIWYMSPIPRFHRLFGNKRDAEYLRWHEEGRVVDDYIRHPADANQWKMVNLNFPDFGADSRNIRLGLSTDGMNPYGNLSSQHSTWPVLLIIYNLPPWICMKRKYVMLTMVISGPKQPGNDIDVYLQPLIDDLKLLWLEGVKVYDSFAEQEFNLRAMLFCTINDFPAYANLSGYNAKGYKACPVCEECTSSIRLQKCHKNVYMDHRRWLPTDHVFRRRKKQFNGEVENRIEPMPLIGSEVFQKVKEINVIFGKRSRQTVKGVWKKCSIFFQLPYWETLNIRHCIDVMHVEKNVCDSLIGTLLDIKGKSKDSVSARLDMVELGLRNELAPETRGNRTFLPPACYTLSKKEREAFCKCLHDIKVPHGYSSNMRKLVSMKDYKMQNMKSHDCHVLMQQFLPIAIRGILPKKVRTTITKLCFFFSVICKKHLSVTELDKLQSDVIVTICEMEMYFPFSFFDIMVHLIIHLVREIKECGPVYLRWMYPFERYMKILKGYVRNRFRPEGSIVEGYLSEEAVEYCTDYLGHTVSVGIPSHPLETDELGRGHIGRRSKVVPMKELLKAHLCVLHNVQETSNFISEHISYLRKKWPRRTQDGIQSEHNSTFSNWLRDRVEELLNTNPDRVTEKLRCLSRSPSLSVESWGGYIINGYCFYTDVQDARSTMQNSGVSISDADNNNFYGVIKEIWELNFHGLSVPIFKCRWYDNRYMDQDEFGFTLVRSRREGYRGEEFVMAEQCRQIFYIPDPAESTTFIILEGKQHHTEVGIDDELIDDIIPVMNDIPPQDDDEDETSNVYIRSDHDEGLWIDNRQN